eukprot:COSAG05_NODE_255_length_12816_cov_13.781631_10_plen_212_part_00
MSPRRPVAEPRRRAPSTPPSVCVCVSLTLSPFLPTSLSLSLTLCLLLFSPSLFLGVCVSMSLSLRAKCTVKELCFSIYVLIHLARCTGCVQVGVARAGPSPPRSPWRTATASRYAPPPPLPHTYQSWMPLAYLWGIQVEHTSTAVLRRNCAGRADWRRRRLHVHGRTHGRGQVRWLPLPRVHRRLRPPRRRYASTTLHFPLRFLNRACMFC